MLRYLPVELTLKKKKKIYLLMKSPYVEKDVFSDFPANELSFFLEQ